MSRIGGRFFALFKVIDRKEAYKSKKRGPGNGKKKRQSALPEIEKGVESEAANDPGKGCMGQRFAKKRSFLQKNQHAHERRRQAHEEAAPERRAENGIEEIVSHYSSPICVLTESLVASSKMAGPVPKVRERQSLFSISAIGPQAIRRRFSKSK